MFDVRGRHLRPMLRGTLLLAAALAAALALAPAAQAADPFNWTSDTLTATALLTVDCSTETLCVAGDANGNVVTSTDPTNANSWSSAAISVGNSINAVSCPTVALCVAVDSGGTVFTSTTPTGGALAWTGVTPAGGPPGYESVDCPTVTLCVAGGETGGLLASSTNPTGGAGAWSVFDLDLTGVQAMFSMSCPTATLCVGGNDENDVWTSAAPATAAWTRHDNVANSAVLLGMSCPTTTFCVASDDLEELYVSTNPTGGPTAWTDTNPTSVGFSTFHAVSCPSVTLCVVGANAGMLVADDPTGGAAAWSLDSTGTFNNDVSCPTIYLCVAVRNGGLAAFGRQFPLAVTFAGTGAGTVTGPTVNCSASCTRNFPGTTPVTLFATPAGDGSTFEGWGGDCTGTGDCSTTMSAARAVTATFTAPATSAPPATEDPPPAGDPPPAQVAQSSEPPPPTLSRTANVYPVKPGVRVRAATGGSFAPLTAPEQIQFGAIIDARKGRVRIAIANGRGGVDTAEFFEGMFRLVQPRARRPIAELQLFGGSFRGCPRGVRASAAARRGRSVRHLWGSGSGSFRTKGRFAAATLRGTTWLTDDRCNGTLARVTQGSIAVRDFVRRRTVVLRASRGYFAAAKRR